MTPLPGGLKWDGGPARRSAYTHPPSHLHHTTPHHLSAARSNLQKRDSRQGNYAESLACNWPSQPVTRAYM